MIALTPLVVVVWVSGGLLIAAGVAKLRDPRLTLDALGALGLGRRRVVAVTLGVSELLVGLAALIVPHWGAGPLALTYGVFAGVCVFLRARHPQLSCGCFGVESVPVTRVHVVATAFASLAGFAVLALHASGRELVGAVTADAPGATLLVSVPLAVWASYLLVAELPRLLTYYRHPTVDN